MHQISDFMVIYFVANSTGLVARPNMQPHVEYAEFVTQMCNASTFCLIRYISGCFLSYVPS